MKGSEGEPGVMCQGKVMFIKEKALLRRALAWLRRVYITRTIANIAGGRIINIFIVGIRLFY